MAQRFHLEQEEQPKGTIWFTLVFESFSNFFVERYNDSDMPFIAERLKNIPVKDFDKYQVNGVSLKRLVAAKLEEIQTGEKKLSTADRGGVKPTSFSLRRFCEIVKSDFSVKFLAIVKLFRQPLKLAV